MTTIPEDPFLDYTPAYEQPGEDAGIHTARPRFLSVVHRLEPRVSTDLMGEPLQLYRPLFIAAMSTVPLENRGWWRVWDDPLNWPKFKYANEAYDPPEILRLRDLVLEWSQEWHLRDDWCLQAAIDTLARWSDDGEDLKPQALFYPAASMIELPFSEDELQFEFSHRGWSPTQESWERAREWMEESFRRALGEYKSRIEALVAESALIPVSPSRKRAGDPVAWLARVVINKDSYSKIAREVGVSRQAVSKAVRKQASAIELTLPDEP